IDLLMRLAREAGLQQSIEALLDGQPVNASEGRPALHTALRRPVGDQVLVNGQDVMPEVHRVLQQMTDLVGRIHSSLWRGHTETSLTDVVDIGIGAPYLGAELVSEPLLPLRQRGVRCHDLASYGGSEFRERTARLHAETPLFIGSSESF